jgi:transposase
MDEKRERQLRRKAIRLKLNGLSGPAIQKQVKRSRRWLQKWWQRFRQGGQTWARSQSRAPRQQPNRYPRAVRQLIVSTRKRLERAQIGLIGAQAIRRELLRNRLLKVVPSRSTIKRVLHDAGIGQEAAATFTPKPPRVGATAAFVVHAMDWTERYLEGGAKVFPFHTLDLETHEVGQTVHTDKTAHSAQAHVLQVWQTLSLPDGLRLDNDSAFCGGYKKPGTLGQFIRLSLYFGVELIFIPVGEPACNGEVESVHALWGRVIWQRRQFRFAWQVARTAPAFEAWVRQEHTLDSLQGRTPGQVRRSVCRRRLTRAQIRQVPVRLPITAGRVHFIRKIAPDGRIFALNQHWAVGRYWAGRYVVATLVTHRHELQIRLYDHKKHTLQLVKRHTCDLGERVRRLRPEFKRPDRPSALCTMS